MSEEIEKKLNLLALENKTEEIKKFFEENIKSETLHQFEFLFWITEN